MFSYIYNIYIYDTGAGEALATNTSHLAIVPFFEMEHQFMHHHFRRLKKPAVKVSKNVVYITCCFSMRNSDDE